MGQFSHTYLSGGGIQMILDHLKSYSTMYQVLSPDTVY